MLSFTATSAEPFIDIGVGAAAAVTMVSTLMIGKKQKNLRDCYWLYRVSFKKRRGVTGS